jgi:hypothetical protein
MTESELLTFLHEQVGDIDVNFQFWLSATFAVLLSFFFAGERITGYIRTTLIALYIGSTILFATRLFLAGASTEVARRELEDMGSKLIMTNLSINGFIGLLYVAIILFGTIAVVYYSLNLEKLVSREKSKDT